VGWKKVRLAFFLMKLAIEKKALLFETEGDRIGGKDILLSGVFKESSNGIGEGVYVAKNGEDFVLGLS